MFAPNDWLDSTSSGAFFGSGERRLVSYSRFRDLDGDKKSYTYRLDCVSQVAISSWVVSVFNIP